MHRIKLLLLLVVLGSQCLFAQKDTIYFDHVWSITSKINAKYYRLLPKPVNGGFLIRDFYISGNLQMEGLSIHQTADMFDGEIKWYYDQPGVILQKAFYNKGITQGEIVTYDKKGNEIAKGIYLAGLPQDGTFGDVTFDNITLESYQNGVKIKTTICKLDLSNNAKSEMSYNDDGTIREAVFYGNDGNPIGKTDLINQDNGLLEGKEVAYWRNPLAVYSIADVHEGKYVGGKIYYYLSGNIKMQEFLTDDYSIEKSIYYDINGIKTDSVLYENGFAYEGFVHGFFNEINDHLSCDFQKAIYHYVKGELVAEKHFFRNGKVLQDKVINTSEANYDATGHLTSKLEYKDGQPFQGKTIEISDDQSNSEISYEQGKKVSEVYYKNDKLSRKTDYDLHGNKIKLTKYYSDGLLKTETTYRNKSENEIITYSHDGKIMGKLFNNAQDLKFGDSFEFDDDTLKTATTYNNDIETIIKNYVHGKLLNEINQNGNSVFYTLDGKQKFICEYKNDAPYNGSLLKYDYENRITDMESYKDGLAHGSWVTYEYTGDSLQTIASTVTYSSGKKNGAQKDFASGKILKSTTYVDGLAEGPSIFYDIEGNKISTVIYKNDKPIDGNVIEYENGFDIQSTVPYKNGKIEGLSKLFTKGKLSMTASFHDGTMQEKTTMIDGEIKYILQCKDNEPYNGDVFTDNTLTTYKNGILVTTTTFDSDNRNKVSEETNQGDTTISKSFYVNGALKEKKVKYGETTDGHGTFYTPQGKVLAEGIWKDDEPLSGTFVYNYNEEEQSFTLLKITSKQVFATKTEKGSIKYKMQFDILNKDKDKLQRVIKSTIYMFEEL